MALTRPNYNNIQTNVEVFNSALTVLHGGSASASVDVGFVMNRASGLVSNVALYWSESTQSFVTAFTSNTGLTNTNIAVTSYANVTTGYNNINGDATISGNLFVSGANIVASLSSANAAIVTANNAVVSYINSQIFTVDGYITANTNAANAAIVTANNAVVSYVNTLNFAQSANAASQQTQINTLQTQVYNNSNVSAYLPTYSGSIGVAVSTTGNLTVGGNLIVSGTQTTVNTETVNTTEYVATINATNVYSATIGNVGSAHTGATLTLATQANIAGPTYLTNNTAVTSLQILGTAARGGAGYHDFLVVTNQAATTTPTKNFRLDSNGNLQIINSNYSNNIFTLTDAGALTVPSLYVNNGIFWAGNNNVISSGGGSAPAGNTGQVQYNSGGTLGASTLYYWSNNAITTTSTVNTGALTATTLTGALQTAAQPNITSVGTLTGLTLSGALTQSSTTAGTITSVLTHGADVNFQLTSQNGTSLNTTGQEVARFGINYNTAGWDSFTQYIRGSAAQNGNQVLWAANTAIATISTSGITLNTGTFTGTIGTSGANTTVAGGLVVAGNLYAQGTLTYVNTETVNTTEYVSTVNATNLYATTIGNIGANMVGTGTYLTSLTGSQVTGTVPLATTATNVTGLTAANVQSVIGSVSTASFPTLNQNTTGSAGSVSASNLTGTTLASGVTASSLTSVGTLTNLTVSGALSAGSFTVPTAAQPNITSVGTLSGLTVSAAIVPNANASVNLGSSTAWWSTVYGTAIHAQYADLAENYTADTDYAPGTVVVFGGDAEITTTTTSHDPRVAGVISTNPAYLMNGSTPGLPVAMTGRVPCLVQGPVTKGQVLVTSTVAGVAQAIDNSQFLPGCVIGKSLETINTNTIETIEVVVGRF